MSWSDRFIGTPFADHGRARTGCDCWGLFCVVYQEELGITLPDYLGDYASVEEQAEVAALIGRGTASPLWVPVSGPAVAFDLAVFRRGRLASHVGIVVRHGLMLHMAERAAARVEPYFSGRWNSRLTGVYRHVELISLGARA